MTTLKLGSQGLIVSGWQALMRLRYRSYAVGLDGLPLKVDGYFGYDDQALAREYQSRTKQERTGEVSERDLHQIGVKPTLLSIHGTGQPDPFGIGYPADIARRLLDVYHWQPVGNYPASSVPMDHSADAGEAEAARLVRDRIICPAKVAFVDYSQGSICGGRVRNRMRNGDLRDRYEDLLGHASIGNPMRPEGSYAGDVDPGGHGIDPDLETSVGPGTCNLAAHGDLYTTCPSGDTGEIERAVFNAVFERFTGPDSIVEQIQELIINPARELPALAQAVLNGGMFLAQGTGPHVQYHLNDCPGTGQTYYEYAITHLRNLAEDRLRALVARLT